jgi:GNAT superfamily N-acetyltransferase
MSGEGPSRAANGAPDGGSERSERGGRLSGGALPLRCAPMTTATRDDARVLLGMFLGHDSHYLASAGVYGDGGAPALERALDLFLARPEIGFVWLAFPHDGAPDVAVGACVVCYAISTSRGALVVKLDDVTIHAKWRGRGVGTAMLESLAQTLRAAGVTRIDCGCHRANEGAWRFYGRIGFLPLDEERLALLL